jgi:hypothetical protein
MNYNPYFYRVSTGIGRSKGGSKENHQLFIDYYKIFVKPVGPIA